MKGDTRSLDYCLCELHQGCFRIVRGNIEILETGNRVGVKRLTNRINQASKRNGSKPEAP